MVFVKLVSNPRTPSRTGRESDVTGRQGPLAAIRVLELGGIGPGLFCGMMLADLGSDLILVDQPGSTSNPVVGRNRSSLAIDLKTRVAPPRSAPSPAPATRCWKGFRAGVAERLGLGPDDLRADEPALVYGRMTGWGRDGPLAQQPGHDINYIAIAGPCTPSEAPATRFPR